MESINSLYDLVCSQIDKWKSSNAVVFDDGHKKMTITYQRLIEMSNKIACSLQSKCLEKEVIGVCVAPNVYTPSILIGILQTGACFYNFESLGVDYVSSVIDKAGIRCLIMDKTSQQNSLDMISKSSGWTIQSSVFEELNIALIMLEDKQSRKQADSLAYCITTSGTTGTPKVVRVPHSCIIPNIVDLREKFHLTRSDIVFLSSPLTFDPSIVDIFMTLSSGACLLVVSHVIKMMPHVLLDMLCNRHDVTVIQATPTLISRLDNTLLPQTLLSDTTKLRVLALGGEKFPSLSLLQSWRAPNNKTRIFNLYGTTEVSCWATCYEVSEGDFRLKEREMPIGSVLSKTGIVVMDTDGNNVQQGQGQLYIESAYRKCYLDDEVSGILPDLVSRATGDIVQVLDNKDIVYLYRCDDQVKRNGRRINLMEIKLVVLQLPFITNCEVLFNEGKLGVFMIIKSTAATISLEKNIVAENHVKKSLPSHYWPDIVVIVDMFPMTAHGKLDKIALWKTAKSAFQEMKIGDKDIDGIMKSAWKEILSIDMDSIKDSSRFLSQGGDSLSAVRLVDQLELMLGTRLPQLLDCVLHKQFNEICSYVESEITQSNKRNHKFSAISESLTGNDSSKLFNRKTNLEKLEVAHNDGENNVFKSNKLDKFSEMKDFNTKTDLHQNITQFTDNRKRKFTINEFVDQEINQNYSFVADENISNTSFVSCVSRGNRIYKVVKKTMTEISTSNKKIKTVNSETSEIRPKLFVESEYMYMINVNMNSLKDTSNLNIQIVEHWKYNSGKCVDASPLVISDSKSLTVVYIGSHSHKFAAVTMETGDILWEITLGDRIESSACLSMCGNYVIVGCYDGVVYCLNRHSGDIWWEFQTAGEVKSSPTLDTVTGFVVVGSHDHHLYALNVKIKKCIWRTDPCGGSVFSSPCVSYNPHCIYACTLSGSITALNPVNGNILWQYQCSKPVFSSPLVTDRGICVGCVNGQLVLVDTSGNLKWYFEAGGPIFSSPVLFKIRSHDSLQDIIIFGSHDSHVYGVTLDGELLWKLECDSYVYSTAFCFHVCLNRNEKIKHKHGLSNYNDIMDSTYIFEKSDVSETALSLSSENTFLFETKINTAKLEEDSLKLKAERTCYDSNQTRSDEKDHLHQGRLLLNNLDKEIVCHGKYCNTSCFNVCVVLSTTGTLYFIDVKDGHVLQTHDLPGEVFSSPVVIGDNIVVGCRDDFVYCLKIRF